ncbi:pentatricopeptide repeat-containing protein At3g47530 [Macadamia integrifolia]|uniref:pentatricopeptide repeat-containing protein At3g47530 n=1 Tax=Macadamia integrifolia TaxID=60698 RepID=UPI001C4F4538|nr:pentatricopeptide repeat-containing protein At3g47530 [Macadamia integrifolia]
MLISNILPSRAPLTNTTNLRHRLCYSSYCTSTVLKVNQQQRALPEAPLKDTRRQPQRQQRKELFGGSENAIQRVIAIIKSCSTKDRLLQIHAHIINTFLIQEHSISAEFLSLAALSPFRDLSYSRKFFSQISEPTTSHYNIMIRAHSRSDSPDQGLFFYNQMRERGVCPNPLSSSFALQSCTRISFLNGGRQIHARILRDGHQSDHLLLTTLMGFYATCENGLEACRVFNEMSHPDTVAWNVLISCYTRNGRTGDALGLFNVMQNPPYGSEPDDVTCLLLLQACAHMGALDFGEKIHSYINEHGYGNAVHLRNSLIAMYSRCGCVDKAFQVFQGMSERNVVTWSAMISGMAMNGHERQAILTFEEMQRNGVLPDDQTFTGVFSACSHGGLVDQGLDIFDRMRTEFGLVPNIHHYGCMVDLLGRAGLLDQAYNLICSMLVKPDATIWRTLLGACRIHGHFELGNRVIEHLIELKGQEAGDYVLLLNIYASSGLWEKVAEMRRFMKEKGIQTTPGSSTIELKGEVHEFVVDDNSHPRKVEIYEMLDEIGKQLKIAGYVADMSAELHNLGMEEKGNALSYHSEKLAIAFGVLATPPGTTIRVAKNLRICVDCHNFAKILSGVYNREVIIRDRSRFHHFREGYCSCQDYW